MSTTDLEYALEQILAATPVLGRESVPILDALGRVLAQDVAATHDLPSTDISAVDGYAVRRADVQAASRLSPVSLNIMGESPAGRPWIGRLEPGEAVRIMTGGVVPGGADSIVKLEDAFETNAQVLCLADPGPGANIRFRGESMSRGTLVLTAGSVVTPVEVGILASLRRAHVLVHQKPLVAILATGDELVDFHEPVQPGKAMCSNLYSLAAQVLDSGATPRCLGIAGDDLPSQRRLLTEGLRADVIITSGGLSMGKYDLVRESLVAMGLVLQFRNVRQKPGKPFLFGTIRDRLIFGVPGNPSAAMHSFDEFIRPALLKMMGHRNVDTSAQRESLPCAHAAAAQIISIPACQDVTDLPHQRASLLPSRNPTNGNGRNGKSVAYKVHVETAN